MSSNFVVMCSDSFRALFATDCSAFGMVVFNNASTADAFTCSALYGCLKNNADQGISGSHKSVHT
jgi:hypothetical protein